MKRNIFSIMLVCLMIVSLFVLTGCKVDDLAVKVDENANKVENALDEAATKTDADIKAAAKAAAANLAAAEERLEKYIAAGDAADTAAISAAAKDFNAALNALEAAVAAADDALAAELTADYAAEIETACKVVEGAAAKALADAKAELEAAITAGDAAATEKVSAMVAEIAAQLANIDALVQEVAIELDAALKAELTATIEANAKLAADNLAAVKADLEAVKSDLKADIANKADAAKLAEDKAALEAQIKAVEDALNNLPPIDFSGVQTQIDELNAALKAADEAVLAATLQIKAWNDATDVVVAAFATVNEYRALFNENANLYYAEDIAAFNAVVNAVEIKLLRAPTVEAANALVAEIEAAYAALLTKADKIEAVLTFNGTKTIEDVEYTAEWTAVIEQVKAMLDAADIEAEGLEAAEQLYKKFYQAYMNAKFNA